MTVQTFEFPPKAGRHNIARTHKMRRRSLAELKAIVESGSLSAAAAAFEIARRERIALEAKKAAILKAAA